MRQLLIVLGLAVAAACGAPAPEDASAQHAAGIEIQNAWAAPTPGGVDVSAGYLTIVNATAADDRLIGASSPRAERVELHEMSMEGGVMRMRAAEALTIPAGGESALAPGGRHLMFFGVSEPFTEGERIPVRLRFARAGEVDVSLPVQRQAAGHAGH